MSLSFISTIVLVYAAVACYVVAFLLWLFDRTEQN
jgi:hypothetical protein